MEWWRINNLDDSAQESSDFRFSNGLADTHGEPNDTTKIFEQSPAPLAPPTPRLPLQPVPASLPELLEYSREAGRTLDHVGSWRAVTAFARDFWLADAEDHGEFYALRHAVTDQLELVDEAEAARQEWLAWAKRVQIPAAILHARSYGAFVEAERFIDANPGDILTGARPSDSDVPELVSLTNDICACEPEPKEAYHFALSAAVTGAAAALARRADLAAQLSEWTAKWVPQRSGTDDRRLLEAQLAHARGELQAAARICASVAENPQSEPVTSTIEARQLLAFLSLEYGDEQEAIRQLRPIVEVGFELDVVVGTLRSARLLAALLNSAGDFTGAREVAARALEASEGMPANPLTMDIQLILARSLLDVGDPEHAVELAVPVAQWSSFTEDEERTDAAFSIAASASTMIGDIDHAVKLLVEHADHLERIGDLKGASKALRQAARSTIHVSDLIDAQSLMDRSRSLFTDPWSIADWNDDLAYIYWFAGEYTAALQYVETAASGYLEAGDGEESARALLTGVRTCLDLGDFAAALEYAARIDKLLPADLWDGHPIRDALNELL